MRSFLWCETNNVFSRLFFYGFFFLSGTKQFRPIAIKGSVAGVVGWMGVRGLYWSFSSGVSFFFFLVVLNGTFFNGVFLYFLLGTRDIMGIASARTGHGKEHGMIWFGIGVLWMGGWGYKREGLGGEEHRAES